MRNTLLTAISFFLLSVISCKKNKSDHPGILRSTTWKWSLIDKNTATNPAYGSVLYYPVKECEKDDSFKFGTDSNLTLNRGGEKCDVNEHKTEFQKYTFDQANKTLVLNGTTYRLLEETIEQIKYYRDIPSITGSHIEVFILEPF